MSKRKRKTKTPRDRVLARYPEAQCAFGFRSHNGAGWTIRAQGFQPISDWFLQPRQAWADAARRLERKP